MTSEEREINFIQKATVLHEGKYEYSKVYYVNNSTKVIIICPTHGEFLQRPNDHTHKNKNGCPTCGKESSRVKRTSNKDSFVKKATEIHGDKYNYTPVDYKTALTKVGIVCKIHGLFNIQPNSHLSGQGCKKCGYEKNSLNRSKDKEVFLEEAAKKHGDRFTYDLTNFSGTRSSINIFCKKHDSYFEQVAVTHLKSKGGCPICKSEVTSKTFLSNTKEFIEKALAKHDSYYDYSKAEYTGNKDKIIITCPVHGDFEQRPNDHLSGCGCIKCSVNERSYYNIPFAEANKESLKEVEGVLYILNLKDSKDNSFIKIGLSKEVDKRVPKIIKESGFNLVKSEYFSLSLYDAIILEQTLIRKLKQYRYVQDNLFAGYSELFEDDAEWVARITIQKYKNQIE